MRREIGEIFLREFFQRIDHRLRLAGRFGCETIRFKFMLAALEA
jgi:hypothetical protein